MGLNYSWKQTAATEYFNGGSSGSEGGSGEGDSSGRPLPERSSPGAFPTIMIEAGYSQSLQYLRQKAKWWFDISNHDIKSIILAKLYLRRRTIILERWEERQRKPRVGATTTRHASV